MQFARNHLCSPLCAALASAFCMAYLTHQKTPGSYDPNLYFLAGTPTNNGAEAFPVTLYEGLSNRRLKAVREIVSKVDGLYSVRQNEKTIFVAHPHVIPTSVCIIHAEDPSLPDDVPFNNTKLVPIENKEGLSESLGGATKELFPLAGENRTPAKGTLSTISANFGSQRVGTDDWSAYSSFRFYGGAGGPALSTGPFGVVRDRSVVLSVFGHDFPVESLPASVGTSGELVWLMVLTGNYSVLVPATTMENTIEPKSSASRTMLAHDRIRNKWQKITTEGTKSRLRIFGPWLCAIVALDNPGHISGPGRQNERAVATDRLPNVRQEYENLAGRESLFLGILTLQNLADGRKIRIVTGQEDSEILRVQGDIVLYRVNDEIYQARIAGDQLKDTTLVVKDDDVPEIHWAFWSR